MTLIVEDGTGLPNSDSYASVASADTRLAALGMTDWTSLSTAQKEQALRRATVYMLQTYRSRWRGRRKLGTQALDWPREEVTRDDYGIFLISGYYAYYPDDEVPAEVEDACIDLALRSAAADLLPDQSQGVVREKVGPLEVEYDRYSPQRKKYSAIDGLLRPLLKADGSGVVRT
jgi:hypothetical protein